MKSKILAFVFAAVSFIVLLCGVSFVLVDSEVSFYTKHVFQSVSSYLQDWFQNGDNLDYVEILAGRYFLFLYFLIGIAVGLFYFGFIKHEINLLSLGGSLLLVAAGVFYLITGVSKNMSSYGDIGNNDYYTFLWGDFWIVAASPVILGLAISIIAALTKEIYNALKPKNEKQKLES